MLIDRIYQWFRNKAFDLQQTKTGDDFKEISQLIEKDLGLPSQNRSTYSPDLKERLPSIFDEQNIRRKKFFLTVYGWEPQSDVFGLRYGCYVAAGLAAISAIPFVKYFNLAYNLRKSAWYTVIFSSGTASIATAISSNHLIEDLVQLKFNCASCTHIRSALLNLGTAVYFPIQSSIIFSSYLSFLYTSFPFPRGVFIEKWASKEAFKLIIAPVKTRSFLRLFLIVTALNLTFSQILTARILWEFRNIHRVSFFELKSQPML